MRRVSNAASCWRAGAPRSRTLMSARLGSIRDVDALSVMEAELSMRRRMDDDEENAGQSCSHVL